MLKLTPRLIQGVLNLLKMFEGGTSCFGLSLQAIVRLEGIRDTHKFIFINQGANSRSGSTLDEVPFERGQQLRTRLGNEHIIDQPHTQAFLGNVDRRLHRQHHAGFQHVFTVTEHVD